MKLFALYISLVLFPLIAHNSFAQGVTSNWHFGNRAGITFQNFQPENNKQNILSLNGACTSISDNNSNLLFYAETDSCIGLNFIPVQGSENLTGSSLTYQGAIFIPSPNDPSTIYLFTVDALIPRRLLLTVIRKTLGNPEGVISQNEKNLLISNNNSGKLSAVHHANGIDIWLVTRTFTGDTIKSYLISETGLNAIPVQSIFNDLVGSGHGQLKISNNGKYIAECHGNGINQMPDTRFYTFNNLTGLASNPVYHYCGNVADSRLGIEFDATSRFVFVSKMFNTAPNRLYRYNLANFDSLSIISSVDSFELSKQVESLQIGIDRKIYGSQYLDSFLFRIENPAQPQFNLLTINSSAVSLEGDFCLQGLPDFITSYFRPAYFDFTNACEGDSVLFMQRYPTPDSVRWDFGDPNSGHNFSSELEPKHLFSDTGTFIVTMRMYAGTIADTFSREIALASVPQAFDFGDSIAFCKNDSVKLNLIQGTDFEKYWWSNGSENGSISIKDSGLIWGVVYNHCDTIYDSVYIAINDTIALIPLTDTTLCFGDTLSLNATANTAVTWLWSNGDSTSQTQVSENGSNEIEIWVEASNACGAVRDTAIITVLPQPDVSWFSDSILCDQNSTVIAQPNTFGVSYTMRRTTDSVVDDTINPWLVDTFGLYYLTAFNICDSVTKRAFLSPFQIIEKDIQPNFALCPGEEVVLDAFWSGSTYLWNESVATANQTDSAVVVSAPFNHQLETQVYTVSITNPPCSKVLSISIEYLSEDSCGNTCKFSLPNVFTPNHDGKNDLLHIENTCSSLDFRFSIYNRWGQLMHAGNQSIASWDGSANGQLVSNGVYFIVIEYLDFSGKEKTVNGSFEVILK